jgi:hypothetical protein
VTITPEYSEEGFTTVQFPIGSCGNTGLYEVTLKDTDPPLTVCVNSAGTPNVIYQITDGNPILTIDSCGCTP